MSNEGYSRPRAGAVVAAILVAGAGGPAMAQALPSREQIELPQLTPPETTTQVSVERPPQTAACPFSASDLAADIRSVNFTDGAGETLPADVAQVLAGIEPVAGNQPLSQICALRDAAADRLRSAGYIAAVTIPEQEIGKTIGTVRLAVLLGRLVGVDVVGDSGGQAARIAARIERLKNLYPLRTADLERELLLASDNPGVDVNLNLASAGRPGELVGRLAVTRKAFALTANVNNFGSRSLGREIGTARAEFYGLTGLADVTFIGASSSLDFEEQWSVQGGHYFSLDSGTTFGGSLAYAKSRPDIGLPIRAKSLLGAIEGYTPVVRTVAARGTVGGGLEIIDQESNLVASGVSVPVTRDKLRVAFAKVEGTRRGFAPDGSIASLFSGTLQVRKGLDILGASERGIASGGYSPSKLDGDPTALVVRGGFSNLMRWGGFGLLTQLQGQYSAKALLAFEEFSVGNYTIGRGYDPSATSGDSALGVRVQPSITVPVRRVTIEPYTFFDAVRIWNEDRFTTENGRSLLSAGAGARFYLGNRFVLDAGYAHPFDKSLDLPLAKRAPDRFLVSLTASFGPSAR
ncbi:ShlB/FhaC/HecB family hemolysin secretion/activation protein [Tsuneonella amylolytica]|uniref:ShlB/FhaC/HecB family hemolysin secretion/activation protein n=1 Tax=Tsuneonella amylolytica TaxID=2338327 RepID=UPI0013C5294C|nr:ShlB/FhaC/HecB family hemolysin secretion/activation protein [Tsuneonella amylolytica]